MVKLTKIKDKGLNSSKLKDTGPSDVKKNSKDRRKSIGSLISLDSNVNVSKADRRKTISSLDILTPLKKKRTLSESETVKTPLVSSGIKKKKSDAVKIEAEPVSVSKKVKRKSSNVGLKEKSENTENVDEKHPNIKVSDVENALKGVIKLAKNNPKTQNNLFNEDLPLFLQINSFKIPKAKGKVKQVFRVPLKHSVLPPEADICLIVPDVKGIKNKNHEEHLAHYEELLSAKNVTGIKKIMTFHEFRTDYDTFELKNRLVDLYDMFLVDGKISGKVVHKSGSIFYQRRKLPAAIKLAIPKLQSHIENALKKVFFHMSLNGDSNSIQIGRSQMPRNELVDNVYSAVEFLEKQFPGGLDNIRSLNVYTHTGSNIPIYISLKNPNDIKIVTLSSRKPKEYKSVNDELTTQYEASVTVRPGGKVILKRHKNQIKDTEKEEIVDDSKESEPVVETDSTQPKEKQQKKKRKLQAQDDSINEENTGDVTINEGLKKKIKKEKSQNKEKKSKETVSDEVKLSKNSSFEKKSDKKKKLKTKNKAR
ncbi:ribosomal L1 domain-containing protein 1-like [Sitophilus oryzae]|uniref:Ribosomal L1 domain-containing protein 1-like n=1 Tax=Sitophilus oryzae TaxID=7048 RepID=A0A6J2XS47_SITOR|nr:ribosomal L1 domain-containing protein 1-like [Sitophilus oryzae]